MILFPETVQIERIESTIFQMHLYYHINTVGSSCLGDNATQSGRLRLDAMSSSCVPKDTSGNIK